MNRHRRALLLTLLVGAALRLVALGQIPPGLYHDEAQHGLDALAVLDGGHLPLYFAANNGREPLYIYLVTAAVALLGRSPLAVRLPAFFVGFLTLAATYDLGRVLWGRKVGLYAAATLSVTLWHVHLSRTGFRAVLLPLFTALALAQAARALRSGRIRHWIAAGALYGAAWYTYTAVRFTPVAIAVLLLHARLTRRRLPLRGLALGLLAAALVLLPLGLYTLRHPDIVLRRTGQVFILSPQINGGDLWGTLLRHTLRTAGMFIVRGDRIWRHNLAWRPVWGLPLGIAFLIGLGASLKRWRDPAAALALLWTATMALPTLLAEDAPHFLRGVGVLPTAALIPALGLDRLTARVRPLRRLPPMLLLGMALSLTTGDYFIRYARALPAYHWMEGGPVELAGEINARLGVGWDGQRMRHGPPTGRTLYVEQKLWESWTALPYLVAAPVHFLPLQAPLPLDGGSLFVVWPYGEWEPLVLPYTPHPAAYVLIEGPQAQGDRDEHPFTTALILQVTPRPQGPAPLARFEGGIALQAIGIRPTPRRLEIWLAWEAEARLEADAVAFVHYLRDGERVAQDDAPPGRGHLPTTFWRAGDVVWDFHPLAGVTPEVERDVVRVGLYRADDGQALSVLDEAGNPAGTWLDIPLTRVAVLDAPPLR